MREFPSIDFLDYYRYRGLLPPFLGIGVIRSSFVLVLFSLEAISFIFKEENDQ